MLGRQALGSEQGISKLSIIAVPDGVSYKAGGVTIDWSTVTAVSADTTLPDGTVVKNGDKYLRFGQPVTEILISAEVQTIDISAGPDPTGGTWTITLNGETTTALAYNASAADVQAAVDALASTSAGDVVVTKSGFVYTLTYRGGLGNVPVVTAGNALTGTASVSVTVATGTAGNASGGLFGPVDLAATDGRQTVARGRTFLLTENFVKGAELNDDHPAGAIEGGQVFVDRLVHQGKSGVTNDATLTSLIAALPSLKLVY
jgi:hypothetical protein